MEYKTKIVDGKEVFFSPDWIDDLEQKIHFEWYYHQARLVYSNCTRKQNLLEIGTGTGLLSDLLKKRGWNTKTLDIDEEKRPDFCNNALDFDYHRYMVEVVLAFEIFEHIPYSTFEKLVCRLSKQGVKEIYFSLPWNERTLFDFSVKLPKLPLFQWSIRAPAGGIKTHAHFWELAKKEKMFKKDKNLVTLDLLSEVFKKNGYGLVGLEKVGSIQYFSARLLK